MTPRSTVSATAEAAKRSPRQRLIEAASELFYAEGVQSVGIDRVIERAGVAKASLYSSFGSKEELVYAYLEYRHEYTLARLRRAADAVKDPVQKILAVFDAQSKQFAGGDFRGCAFNAASAEAQAGGRVDQATRSYRDDLHALFTELATGAGAAQPQALARQLQLVYDGGGVAARADGDGSISGPQRAAAEALIEAAIRG